MKSCKPLNLGVISTHTAPACGFGGPAESVATLIRSWQKLGVRTLVCTSDGSSSGAIRPSDISYIRDSDLALYKAYWAVRWGFGLGAIKAVCSTVYKADAVYINGFATFPTTLGAIVAVLCRKPFVVASRGGLVEEHIDSVRQSRPVKWWFYKILSFPFLRRAKSIHAASQLERQGVLRVLPHVPVCIAPNGVESVGKPNSRTRVFIKDKIAYLFVGRISREKGIRQFLEVWLESCRPKDRFLIAGEGHGTYMHSVKELARKSKGQVVLLGWVDRNEIKRLMLGVDFIVLPSGIEGMFRENFGNAVAEALSLGTPPIVSCQTIWSELADKGVGFHFSSKPAGIKRSLLAVQNLTAEDYKEMSLRCIRYAKRNLSALSSAKKILAVFG